MILWVVRATSKNMLELLFLRYFCYKNKIFFFRILYPIDCQNIDQSVDINFRTYYLKLWIACCNLYLHTTYKNNF